MRFRVALAFACLCCSLAGCGFAYASAGDESVATSAPSATPAHYPDDALLSNYRYANAYFGFSVDLPADAGLRPVPTSNPLDGSIALLETIGSSQQRCMMAISAHPASNKGPDARLLLRRELDEELSIGVEELHGLTKTSIAGHPFFYYETRRGVDQHAIYATDLNGYTLRFVAAGRDAKLVQQLEAAVTHMRFFPPESIGDYIGVGAQPYNGPAIPYHVIEQLKSNPPAHKLEAGGVTGNVYENRELGFGYELPKDWHYGTEAAIMPAIEHSRESSYGKPAVPPSQRALLKACERTLVSAWRKMPEQTGQIAYEDFGEVTISAMSLACFPNAKFPDLKSAKDSLADFVVAYGLGHPIVQEMKGARAFEHDGRTFILMNGVVAYHEAGDKLSRRVSVALALTKHRDYVLSFFFAAPHDSELHDLMNAKAAFDPEPMLKNAGVTGHAAGTGEALQPGGSVAPAGPVGGANDAPQVAGSGSAGNSATSTGAQSQDDSSAQTSSAASTASYHPSLLRPGETMQDQQMKGTSAPKKK